ncbi:MAG: Hpt domain-containing protein [Devosia sp.]|uniref:Hpt domain-containing protein n=1 Tax=unclassified Devosia TaxID=196773 RepID=UPI000AFB5D76|nr:MULTISPECIES: Hpt domain-containing protein [unclassified Devosia]MBL8597475.1 Hpt domain-containing protein [Devosia sp.]MBN9347550.1 Hpt domain-containing protein [Devosia sp.]
MRGDNTAKAAEFEATEPEIRRPIDMEHLSRQTLGDPGLEEEVLRLFDQMTHTYYERLEISTSVDELLRNLHTLKGAAAGVGAFGLAELARVAEQELREGAPVNPERIDDLAVAVQEVSAFIGDRLRAAEAA